MLKYFNAPTLKSQNDGQKKKKNACDLVIFTFYNTRKIIANI